MALNLGMPEGSKVYIGDRPLIVQAVTGLRSAELRDDQGGLHHVSDNRSTEIYPGVFVSVGLKSQMGMISISFEADKNIVILREDLYLAQEHGRCVSS